MENFVPGRLSTQLLSRFAPPPLCVSVNSRHHMFRLLGTVARGSTAVGFRQAPKTGLGGGGPATTALFCISALWGVGQTVSFATVRTPQAMSSTVDVSSACLFCFCTKRKETAEAFYFLSAVGVVSTST